MKHVSILAIITLLLASTLAAAQVEERTTFTSNKDASKFGYDYVEGFEYRSNGIGVSYSECYEAQDTSDHNFAYLGKALDGSKAYQVGLRINAANDGYTSGVAAAFSFVDVLPSSTGKGDGKVGGAFQDSVKVKFKEDDGHWVVWFTEVTAGVETTRGSAFDMGSDPSNWQTYQFRVDTRDQTIALYGAGATPLMTAALSGHSNAAIHSQWFVAWGYAYAVGNLQCIDNNAPSTVVKDVGPEAPVISNVDMAPAAPDAAQAMAVTATIADDWSDLGAPTATLSYQVNSGAVQTVAMTASGTTYAGTIPGQASGAKIGFWVTATDVSGLETRSNDYEVIVGSGNPATDKGHPGIDGGPPEEEVAINVGLAAAAAVLFAAGLALFILLRRQNGKVATTVILSASGLAAALATLAVMPGLYAALAGISAVVYALIGLVVVAVVVIWRL